MPKVKNGEIIDEPLLKPLLSVCLITYNHAKFIGQALNSVLMQEVDFAWEIVIADDCSTDGTDRIVSEIAARHPALIRPILHKTNLGPDLNFKALLSAAKGEYIAYLEGDDYWTDPLKLQRQVEFLEKHPDYAGCSHNAEVHYLNRKKADHTFLRPLKDEFTFEDIIRKDYVAPTGTLVFRRIEPEKISSGLILLDWVLLLLIASSGRIKYFDEVMAVYRQHSGGWTNKNWTQKALELIDVTLACKAYFSSKYSTDFDKILARDYADVCFGYFQDGEISLFLDAYKKYRIYWLLLPARRRRALVMRKILSVSHLTAKAYSTITGRVRSSVYAKSKQV